MSPMRRDNAHETSADATNPMPTAIASDPIAADAPIPHVSLNDIEAIADLVERHAVGIDQASWGELRRSL